MKASNLTLNFVKYYFTPREMFEGFNTRKLEASRKALRRGYGQSIETRELCCRVFSYFLYLIILDIIRNNITFIFPTRKEMVLGVNVIRGERLHEQLRENTPKDYDYFGSGMTLPRINLFYRKGNYELRVRYLVLNATLMKEFFKNINNGKVYG